ncbi:hypothetical protein IB239_23730, partial [Pseudomonas sp. PDM12]
ANGTDKIQVKNWFASDSNAMAGANDSAQIERIEFADGSVWGVEEIQAAVITMGSETSDKLVGWSGTDFMYGGAGNDTLDGGSGYN